MMAVGGEKAQKSGQEVLPQHRVIHRDRVGDLGHFAAWLPSHAVELVLVVGQRQRLDLGESKPNQSGTDTPAEVCIWARLAVGWRRWCSGAEVVVAMTDGQVLDEVHMVQHVKPPTWHGHDEGFVGIL